MENDLSQENKDIRNGQEKGFSLEDKKSILNRLNKKNKIDEFTQDKTKEEKEISFNEEDKKSILNRLKKQKEMNDTPQAIIGKEKRSQFSEEEKEKVLRKLNEKRLAKQKQKEIVKDRTENKKIFKFEGKDFYQFTGMEREYFILVTDAKSVGIRPKSIYLYYKTFDVALNKKEVIIKTEIYSDRFFISYDKIRILFKAHSLKDI